MASSRARDEDLRLQLQCGRTVSYARYGREGGSPIVFCHGFPGCRLQARYLEDIAYENDLLLIAPDRPGIGFSTNHWIDAIGEWPTDVSELADTLDVGRFSVIGVSGGGPYALALAARLNGRVNHAALVASPCELDATAIAQLGFLATVATRIGRVSPRLMRLAVRRALLGHPNRTSGYFEKRLDRVDREQMAVPPVKTSLALNRREALRTGTGGLEREAVLYTRPWGFAMAEVKCPVEIWHGGLDRLTPPFMAIRLAEDLGDARLHLVGDEGHLSLLHTIAEQLLDSLQDEGR